MSRDPSLEFHRLRVDDKEHQDELDYAVIERVYGVVADANRESRRKLRAARRCAEEAAHD